MFVYLFYVIEARDEAGGCLSTLRPYSDAGGSDSLSRDGRVMVVNRQVQPQALAFFTE